MPIYSGRDLQTFKICFFNEKLNYVNSKSFKKNNTEEY